jgi:H+-transporting ATPase
VPVDPAKAESEAPAPRRGGLQTQDERSAEDRRSDEALTDDEGLSSAEARERLERYGPNALEEKKRNVVLELLSHFWGPIPWMIEGALVLTLVEVRFTDFGIILALLVVNGGVGFWEEHQAANAIAALKEQLAKEARVKRDGGWTTVPAEELVPGDLAIVDRGKVVPADGRVVGGEGESDESSLTGESLPVAKQVADSLFSGSTITRGNVVMRVLATGSKTVFGRTAELAGAEQQASHFQKAVTSIGKYLIVLALVLVATIIAVELVRGKSPSKTFEFALVVAIASIPVALPAVLSVTMAIGARLLAAKDAIVSHLPAVEEMAGVSVLCADKTGTITKNDLAVAEIAPMGGSDEKTVLLDAALTAEPGANDPLDNAILTALDSGGALGRYEVVDLEPFDAIRKRADAKVRGDGGVFQVSKGAVQAILDLTGGGAADEVSKVTAAFAKRGYRALGVARADSDGAWRLVGVLGLQDPPRDDSQATLEQAEKLGLEVKMITGDRVEIAREIAEEVGLGSNILEPDVLEGESADITALVDNADGFAQVVPEHKYRIVKALQDAGRIVAMTGDGVNDAPALRRADAGVAVSGATDAARAAADIVLLCPGLSVIVEALRVSRQIFRRMTNYAIYRITETIRVVVFVTVAILSLDFFPVTAVQVVLLALLNDAAIISIAFDRVHASPSPERWHLRDVLTIASLLGLVGVVESFSILLIGNFVLDLNHDVLRSLIYLKLSVAGSLTLYIARTRSWFWSVRPAVVLFGAVSGAEAVATLIAHFGLLMTALPWRYVGLAWGWAIVWMFILDVAKVATYHHLGRHAALIRATGITSYSGASER